MIQASAATVAQTGKRRTIGRRDNRAQLVGARMGSLWREYVRRPQGVVGLAMLAVYIFAFVAAPILTPYNPQTDLYLADRMAAPAWMSVFPAWRGLPRSRSETISPESWNQQASQGARASPTRVSGQDALVVELQEGASITLTRPFSYTDRPPSVFSMKLAYKTLVSDAATGLLEPLLVLRVVSPSGREIELWDSTATPAGLDWTFAEVDSRDMFLKDRLGLSFLDDPAPFVFSEKGDYRIVVTASLPSPTSAGEAVAPATLPEREETGVETTATSFGEAPTATVILGKTEVRIPGRLHGILGADHIGSDLWAQLVYGTRISLLIGVLTAVISVAIGTLVGVVAGYVGGTVDEVLMRFTDVMLSIPLLPILIILGALFGKSVWNVVFLVAIFSWMGTARIVRSQTLSLKERAFVEAARAAGARSGYIIPVHILPNVMPLVFAAFVLRIPTAIVTEATLSFLGLGDPRVPTWGRMLHNARGFGAFTHLAWWWILPPGLAITLLSLSFVFIGNTMNEIFNPRYRERS